ncbi:MAG: hypothetical protein QXO51_01445 [Halobacteria archaeon]
MADVDSLLCKELSRTHGVNPLHLIEVVGRFAPEDREGAMKFLLSEKNMSDSVAEKTVQAAGAYWHRVQKEKRRKQALF